MNKQTANLLEQHFDTAFAAPDGIKKLRELILTLAMQGKLVEQDPNDPPASELLKEIEAKKQRFLKAGKIKQPKPLLPIKLGEVPYDLPKGWEWVRLGEIGIINPRNNADVSVKAGFVPMPLITEGFSEKHQFEERQWGKIKTGYTHFADGDVGMAKITPCFENAKSCVFSGLPNGIGAGTTELHIFRNSFNSVVPRFLLYYLKNPNYISKAVQSMTGSAGQKRVTTSYFIEQLFPLPPLTEQHRIVARIDQLMARCDELEILRNQREEKRLAVHAAAIRQLLDAPDGSAWDFIQQHFNELYSVKENVAELRKAILQLAVMGKLVPQDPNDPPASELLKEIEAEKQRLVNAGTIKNPKPLPPIQPDEIPYDLPKGWEWVRLGEVVLSVTGGGTPSKNNPGFWGGEIPWASVKDLNVETYLDSTIDSITGKAVASSSTNLIPKGSVIVCTRMGLGKIAINRVAVAINQDLKALAISSHVDQMFFFKKYKNYKITGSGMTVHGIRQDELLNFLFPLPPFSEQHRIVARIDQLMALCDKLEHQIDATTNKKAELLNALTAHL